MTMIFSVFDSKAQAFIQPLFSQTRGTAIRAFTQAANDQAHDFNRFAEDYTLFELGSFDPNTGKFDLHSTPESLCLASTVITATE